MREHAVVIVGGGPTGLMLSAELALAGVDVAVVERRSTQALRGSRAGGLHARTIEVLDQRGIAERFLAEGKIMQVAGFAMIPLDITDAPTRRNHGLALTQNHFERILAAWVAELPVTFYRARRMTRVTQDDDGVDVEVAVVDGETEGERVSDEARRDAGGEGRHETLRARYVVGCDGGRSLVRKEAGIPFPGWDASLSYLIAEMETTETPPRGVRSGDKGINAIGPMDDGKRVRAVLIEPEIGGPDDPTLDELRSALVAVYGTDFGFHDVTWLSRFTDMARQAASYRARRVFLAGDAAHVHGPTGGQGLNLGVQDAVNLGWKLASVVRGTAPDALLDTYHAERHPVGARVLENALAQTALMRGDARTKALHANLSELLKLEEPRKRYGCMMSGLDIHYDLGSGHPLLGRRLPDLVLAHEGASTQAYALLRDARPICFRFGGPPLDLRSWATRVALVEARYDGVWELPVIGPVAPPTAILVRPDGYVAWIGEGSDEGLHGALERWFGPAR